MFWFDVHGLVDDAVGAGVEDSLAVVDGGGGVEGVFYLVFGVHFSTDEVCVCVFYF